MQAQSLFDRSENVTVQERPRPEYEPLGLRIGGGFLLYPKVIIGETVDDNIVELPSSDLLDTLAQQLPDPQRFTQFTNKMAPLTDAVTSVSPGITIQSNWNQNSVKLTADTTINRWATYPYFSANYPEYSHTIFMNSDQYKVAAAATLNVHRDLTINVDASYGHLLLPRNFDGYLLLFSTPTALAITNSFAPLYLDQSDAKLQIVKDFSRFKITVSGEFQNSEYPDGFGPTFIFNDISPTQQPNPDKSFVTVNRISQSYHNHDAFAEYFRTDYALSPDIALFVEQTVTETQYPNILFRNRFDRDTLVGVNFQIPSLMTAEIGVGNLYSRVYYAGLNPIDTPDIRAKITYFPTPLVDLTLSASQFIVDSGVPQAPNYLDRNVGLQANYELLRNLILTGHVTAEFEKYRDVDRDIQIYAEGLSATYLMNRAMRVTLAFSHRQFTSDGSQEVIRQFNEFDENLVTLALTLQH
jgi:hypothetical protein